MPPHSKSSPFGALLDAKNEESPVLSGLFCTSLNEAGLSNGGGSRIRTHGPREGSTVFKTASLNRTRTSRRVVEVHYFVQNALPVKQKQRTHTAVPPKSPTNDNELH